MLNIHELFQSVTEEEEMGLAGAAAEDAESEYIRKITETQIVTGGYIVYMLRDADCYRWVHCVLAER